LDHVNKRSSQLLAIIDRV